MSVAELKDFWPVQKSPSSKAIAIFSRGAYWQYVSAHGPKRAKSGSPKVRKKSQHAAGGFFQQAHYHSRKDGKIKLRQPRLMSGRIPIIGSPYNSEKNIRI